MDTHSQDTARMTRIEAARQAALGTLSRARETLQVAATTVPAWARGVELKAGEQVDALLERVGLVRIAKVEAKRPAAVVEAAPVSVEQQPAVEPEAKVEATAEPVEAEVEAAVEATAEAVEAKPEAKAEAKPEAHVEAHAAGANDRSKHRRRR